MRLLVGLSLYFQEASPLVPHQHQNPGQNCAAYSDDRCCVSEAIHFMRLDCTVRSWTLMHILISSDGGVSWIKVPLKVDKFSNMLTYLSFGSISSRLRPCRSIFSMHFLVRCCPCTTPNRKMRGLW